MKLIDSIEDLLWLALQYAMDAKYYFVDGSCLGNPEVSLKARNVPERVEAARKLRAQFTAQLTELRLNNDYGSSGLWNERGQMLAYDLLDLPFSLLRRIAKWQRDFDETIMSPETGDDAWWLQHDREEIEISRELQAAIGNTIIVKIFRDGRYQPINEIADNDCGELR